MSEADILAQWWVELAELAGGDAVAWWRIADLALKTGRVSQDELDRIMELNP